MTQDRRHEKYIADNFIKLYDPAYQFVGWGDDHGQPDILYQKGSEVLGVEVTTAYYSDAELKLRNAGRLHNPDAVLCDLVQERLDKKASKKYYGSSKVVLCIEAVDPLSDKRLIAKCAEQLFIPPEHPFREIFLLLKLPPHESGDYYLVKIK